MRTRRYVRPFYCRIHKIARAIYLSADFSLVTRLCAFLPMLGNVNEADALATRFSLVESYFLIFPRFLEVKYKRDSPYKKRFIIILFKQYFYSTCRTTRGSDVIVALMQYTMPQYFSADSHSCDCFIEGQKFNGAVKPGGIK